MGAPESKLIADFHTYWRRLGAGGVPDRQLFDPVDIPRLLPNLVIVELLPESQRLRYRLLGTKADEYAGFNMAGVYLDELYGRDIADAVHFFEKIYRRIARSGVPEGGTYQWPSPRDNSLLHVAFAIFPFTLDGAIRQFFCIEDYTEVYGADGTSPAWSVAPLSSPSPSPLPSR